MAGLVFIVVALFAAASAVPVDPIVSKLDSVRYQYVADDEGTLHLADLWLKVSSLREVARYSPDTDNIYHLFTRNNPSRSQVLVFGNPSSVSSSQFDARRRTVVVVHGWNNHATSPINSNLVPAFLAAEDVNVIVVDWNAGAGTIDYSAAVVNTATSGASVARFITWLNSQTGARLSSYHITGHSLGGQQSGIIGRNLGGEVPHITSLDPAFPGWITNSNRFRSTDGIYTEVIHTNGGILGVLIPIGDVDFYPNGGVTMAGCNNTNCSHNRAYYYMAESVASGGFTGRRCNTYQNAVTGNCDGSETLNMGGNNPKTGRTGVFHLETNANRPFSRG